jgi:hypothetical protein
VTRQIDQICCPWMVTIDGLQVAPIGGSARVLLELPDHSV